MNILLIGEYSNVHWTLAEGLRKLGHNVTVASNGDFWKDYKRDVSLTRNYHTRLDGILYYCKVLRTFQNFRNYNVVQLINPMFLELKAERILRFYKILRRNNQKVFLSAMGMDHFYVKTCLDGHTLSYSELFANGQFRDIDDNRAAVKEWLDGPKGILNKVIAKDCNGIVAGLWEYYESYRPFYNNKLTYIPLPVQTAETTDRTCRTFDGRIRFFIGIQRDRSVFKGTDILLDILEKLQKEYPHKCSVTKVENVPFAEYKRLLTQSDVLVDQLYSPSPNMNSLLAMSKGIVVAGGGEEAPYILIDEPHLRPIINLPCDKNGIYKALRDLILNPEQIVKLKEESIEFVRKHHTPETIAAKYLDFWNKH